MDSSLFATWEDLSNRSPSSNIQFKFQLKFFTVYISYIIADTQLNIVCNIKFVPLTHRYIFTITILQPISLSIYQSNSQLLHPFRKYVNDALD